MSYFFGYFLLPVSVFITGACILIIEVVALRFLSPFFGNTIFTVSSVMSVVLGALSAGYYVGGKLVDRNPSLRVFFGIIFAGGLSVILVRLLGLLTLPVISSKLSLMSGPLISSLILFFLPSFLLGMLSPYAIKLQSIRFPEEGVGSVSGKIFFWSTLGSIVGSLLAGFFLIPHFGVKTIFVSTGIVLGLLGFLPLFALESGGKSVTRLGVIVLVLMLVSFVVFLAWQGQITGEGGYSKDGVYEKIDIIDGVYQRRPARLLFLDRNPSSAMFLDTHDPGDLVFEYPKYSFLYRLFRPDLKDVLVIGGGAYTIPRVLLAKIPNVKADVAEVEPSLFNLAKQYFELEDYPNLNNFVGDGRRLLRDSNKQYDLIFADAYSSFYSLPVHLVTREFFSLARQRLSKDGVFIANIVGDLTKEYPSLPFAVMKTMKSVFPQTYFFAVDSPTQTKLQNLIFIGFNGQKEVDFNHPALAQSDYLALRSLAEKMIDLKRVDLSANPLLTDDYAPVEYLAARMLWRFSRGQ